MILHFLRQRGLLLALVFIAGWGAALKLENRSLTNRLAQCQEGRSLIMAAVNEADALAQAAREDLERHSADNAKRSDVSHDQDLERAADAARRFASANRIAAGGVRPAPDRSESIKAPAAAEGDSPGISTGVSADPFVAVASADLQTCTAAVTYAVAAHNWAAGLANDRGSEPPVTPQLE